MKAIEIQPGQKPKIVEITEDLDAIRNVVGKEMQALCFYELVAYVDANGRKNNLPANGCFDVWQFRDTILHGPILVVRAVQQAGMEDQPDDGSIRDEDLELVQQIWRKVQQDATS